MKQLQFHRHFGKSHVALTINFVLSSIILTLTEAPLSILGKNLFWKMGPIIVQITSKFKLEVKYKKKSLHFVCFRLSYVTAS